MAGKSWTDREEGLLKRALRLYDRQYKLIHLCEPELAVRGYDPMRTHALKDEVEEVAGLRIDRDPQGVAQEVAAHADQRASRCHVPASLLPYVQRTVKASDGENEHRVQYIGTQIRTVDDARRIAELPEEEWEAYKVRFNGNQQHSKDEDGGSVIANQYVQDIQFRRRVPVEALEPFEIQGTTLDIHVPKTPKPNGRGVRTSVHYSDLHIPHHDPAARSILLQILERTNPETVVDHGDTMDCEEISKYEKDPYNRTSQNTEIQMGARHLGEVHALSPNAHHIWEEGNHEKRLRALIWKLAENRQAGEILTLPSVTEALRWENLLGIGALGWECVPYPKHIVYKDKLILAHGSVVRKHSGHSAKGEYDRYGKSGMSGHTHRRGVYEHRDYNGWHAWWELGMLGRIRDDYVAFPDWQQGMAVVTWSPDYEYFNVEEIRIHDGRAYFRGEMLEGDPTDTLAQDVMVKAA